MQVSYGLKTARSWDSFSKTLKLVMENLRPNKILEYGPGTSTKIMSGYDFVNSIYSVEHSEAWFYKYKKEMNDKVFMTLCKDLNQYPYVSNERSPFDLIFIDGRERERCMDISHNLLSKDGVVIIHDSEREQYQDGINKFKHIFFTDCGNTCTMTDSEMTAFNLDEILCA